MRRFGLRWLYLIIGGALVMPFVVLMTVTLGTNASLLKGVTNADPILFAAALPLVAVSGFVLPVRALEVPMARTLLAGPAQALDPAGGGSRPRVALYWFLHLTLGGVVSGLTLAVPPGAVIFILVPLLGDLGWTQTPPWMAVGGALPLLGLALLAGLAGIGWAVGALMARLAPALLGPSPSDRITVLKRTAEELGQRNRLARELHDSVGHTLSIVMLQASAAARVLDSDPAFVKRALTHIEETARDAQSELDDVIGLLRSFGGEVRHIAEQAGRAGVALEVTVTGDETRIPAETAHDLHQIVREGLTNVIRHAGPVPAELVVIVKENDVEMTLTNPLGQESTRQGGGRGLLGIRERVAAVRGQMHSGVSDQRWRLFVKLPFGRSS